MVIVCENGDHLFEDCYDFVNDPALWVGDAGTFDEIVALWDEARDMNMPLAYCYMCDGFRAMAFFEV